MRRITDRFSVFELIIIALMAALGIAVKPVASSLAKIITGPLAIPGGVLAGGLYMMFLVLAAALTRGRLSGTLTGLVQAILVILTGAGSHGALSLITYLCPGLAVDAVILIFALFKQSRAGLASCFFGGMAANLAGSFLVGIIALDMLNTLPPVPLLLALSVASLSGGLGGVLAWGIARQIARMGFLPGGADRKSNKQENPEGGTQDET